MPAAPSSESGSDEPGALLARVTEGDNSAPISVSALAQALKHMVEQGFGHVRVRGEISGFKRATSGHLYMALKDADAVIDAVMWKGAAARIPFRAEDGLDVIATGKLTTYPGRSKYQIVVDALELAGEGALLALLEKTKARLAAEGLFSQDRKRALPSLPRVIGVVTSPTGAVIRDILHRLDARFPTRVIVWPVLVQGSDSAAQIAAAIRGFSAMAPGSDLPRPDLVIVARGGGSIEDLWSFNEEVVVRAAAACTIPLISAVGHETDTTLIDFAADVRAPTPTAAAEMAVPVRAELAALLGEQGARLGAAMARQVRAARDGADQWGQRLPGLDRLVAPQRQRLDEWGERLPQSLRLSLSEARRRLADDAASLRPALVAQRLLSARDRLESLWRLAGSLDPRAMLARGYAIVTAEDGGVITNAVSARAAVRLHLGFGDGVVPVIVSDGDAPLPPIGAIPSKARAVAATRPARSGPDKGQIGLFD